MKYFYMIYAAAIVVMSLVAFVLYYADKVKAKKGAWRIKEAVLLGCGFFCGAVGALLGMQVFRHKTKHWYFVAINAIGLIWQVGLVVALALLQ